MSDTAHPGPAPRPNRRPPRLWLDKAKNRWIVLNGTKRVNTGCSISQSAEAQQALIRYIETLAIEETGKPGKLRPADRVSVAEVVDYYLKRKGDKVARPRELGQRMKLLLKYLGHLYLSDIDEDTCNAFAVKVKSDKSKGDKSKGDEAEVDEAKGDEGRGDEGRGDSYARRILADLQAGINLYRKAKFLRDPVEVSLPAAPEAREDYFTPEEAMVLLRMMRTERMDGRYVWRHLIPYLGVSIVSCSRASRVYRASFVPEKGRPHIDVRTGVYTRMFTGEKKTKKRAPDIILTGRLLASMRRWTRSRTVDGVEVPGLRYVCQYPDAEGNPKAVDPKRSFATILRHAAKRHPHLFRRPDGEPKYLVRHSLRHTGITWMAMAGVDPYQIIRYAGITMKVFETVYAHSFPGGLDAVMEWQRKVKRLTE